nr:MAG TPA: hypothetical protein [Caudoviricetes sp.]
MTDIERQHNFLKEVDHLISEFASAVFLSLLS